MVPVIECRIPQVTVVSVTARPVVFTADVGKLAARRPFGAKIEAPSAAPPRRTLRRVGAKPADGLSGIRESLVILLSCFCRVQTISGNPPCVGQERTIFGAAQQYAE